MSPWGCLAHLLDVASASSPQPGNHIAGPVFVLASFYCVAHRFLHSFQLPYHPVCDFQKFFLSLELSLIFYYLDTLPSYPEVGSIFCLFFFFCISLYVKIASCELTLLALNPSNFSFIRGKWTTKNIRMHMNLLQMSG